MLLPLPLLLLLSSPGSGRLRRASVLPLTAAVLLCLVPVSTSFPAHNRCSQDCAKLHRQTCPRGSSFCGECEHIFQEDEDGRCVLTTRHHRGKTTPSLDEEIDFYRAIIAKQVHRPFKEESSPAVATSFQQTANRKIEASRNSQKNQTRLAGGGTTAPPPPPVSGPPNPPTPQPMITGRAGPIAVPSPGDDKIIILIISLCVVVGSVAVIVATVCIVKMQRVSRLAEKVDYPAFRGSIAPAPTANGTSMGDNTLAKSAQMFHYQHQKQQMISMGNNKPEQKVHDTDVTSDEEEVGGDFTVYECPGLAPTGEMEVKNPLFDDSTLPYQENPK